MQVGERVSLRWEGPPALEPPAADWLTVMVTGVAANRCSCPTPGRGVIGTGAQRQSGI